MEESRMEESQMEKEEVKVTGLPVQCSDDILL